MYKNFSENKENNKNCYKTYCNVFESENIGFSRPSQDKCEICLSYKNNIKDFDHDSDQCAECIAYAKKQSKVLKLVLNTKSPSQRKLFVFPLICKELLYSLNSPLRRTYLQAVWILSMRHSHQRPLVNQTTAFYGMKQLLAVKHMILCQRSCNYFVSVMKITSGYEQITIVVRTKNGICSMVCHNV